MGEEGEKPDRGAKGGDEKVVSVDFSKKPGSRSRREGSTVAPAIELEERRGGRADDVVQKSRDVFTHFGVLVYNASSIKPPTVAERRRVLRFVEEGLTQLKASERVVIGGRKLYIALGGGSNNATRFDLHTKRASNSVEAIITSPQDVIDAIRRLLALEKE